MSDYTIETINLTETARLRVEADQDASNPRVDWDMATGFVKIGGRGDSRIIDVEAVHDDPIQIRDAHERIHRSVACAPNCPWGSRHRVHVDEQDVVRWARIFHGMHVEYDSEHGGYWFVGQSFIDENAPLLPEGTDLLQWQAEVVESDRDTYRQWAEGEVCGVILERRVSYVKVIDSDSDTLPVDVDWDTLRDEWEVVEDLWGCYLDDDYTAQAVAHENFSLTDEETAALGLPERRETPAEATTGVSSEW